MEYEIADEPRAADEDDSDVIRNHPALKNQSSVDPNDYPGDKSPLVRKPDTAEHIPEQERE